MSQPTAEQESNKSINKGDVNASTDKTEVEQLRDEVKRLTEELEKQKKRSDELLNSLKYLKADYDNLIKRTNKEIDEIKRVASERVIKEIIDLKEIVEGALRMMIYSNPRVWLRLRLKVRDSTPTIMRWLGLLSRTSRTG